MLVLQRSDSELLLASHGHNSSWFDDGRSEHVRMEAKMALDISQAGSRCGLILSGLSCFGKRFGFIFSDVKGTGPGSLAECQIQTQFIELSSRSKLCPSSTLASL